MATSSAMSTSNTYVKYTISITQNSQSVANNTSNVTVSVRFYRTNSGYTTYGTGTVYCKINGTQYSASVTPSQKITNSGIVLFTKTLNISHGTDGKKTLTCSAWIDHNAPLTSSEQSYSQTLTTIPRKSTLSASSGTLGTAQTLSVTRQDDRFTHTITYACGSSSGTVCTKSSNNSISWTPPVSLSSENTTGTTVSITLTITTYNGSASIGSNTETISCEIPASVKPSVSISVSDPTGNFSTFGAYVQGQSKMKIVLNESGAHGSTIKSRKITADGSSYTDATVTTGAISGTGELTTSATVTDTRGRTGTASTSISVLEYAYPKVTAISAKRSDATGAASSSGAYLCVTFDSTITALNNKNSATYTVQYKKSGAAEHETATLSSYAGAYTVTGGTFVFPAETTSSYEIILTAADAFKEVHKTVSGPSISKLFSILAAGKGWAFGKIAEVEDCTDMTGFEKTYLGPQSFLGGEGSSLEKKLYFVTPDGVTYPHKVRFYGGNGESQTAVGLYDDAIGESAVGIIWNYNDVLRTLNVKIPLVSNGGISVFDTGITLDQCAYTQLVIKKKSGQNGDAIQFSDCDSGKTNWRVNAYRDVSGTDDSSLRFQADNAGDGSFSSNLILYPGGLVSATGDFEAGGNTTLKGNATVNGWHYVKGQLRLDDEIRLYYNGASSLTGIIYQPNDYTINLGTYNGNGTLRYMQWLGEPSDSKRFVLRPSTNGGGYLGTTSMRWNTGFFTNTITQSDAKDKIHVRDLGQEALSFLSALRPVSFVFKDGEGGRTHLGLIAQEVAGAAEDTGMGDLSLYQAVRLDEEGNEHPYSPQAPDEQLRWGLNYQELIAPLIAAVQQLSRETQQLSREIEDLRDQLSALQQQKEENI